MAARAVTRRYNSILARLELEVTEFSLLAAIKLGRHESIAELAERLAFERTTLVRNLRRIAERGLIEPVSDKGRAVRYVTTRKGDRLLSKALPLWVKAQAFVHEQLPPDTASTVLDALTDLRTATRPKS
jgi:DNA-binding MarR family transcriptional regulator